ncbi:MAG: peptidyl-dipeptidase A [Alcanivorax sp.]|jgi:peptidyl-dipeptidase A
MKSALAATFVILILSSCSQNTQVYPANAHPETAGEFVERANREMKEMRLAAGATEWLWATHISHDTGMLVERSRQKEAQWHSKAVTETLAFDGLQVRPTTRRALDLLKLQTENPAPPTLEKQAELSKIAIKIEGMYGTGEHCTDGGLTCLSGADLEELIGKTRDYDEALDYWLGWRKVSVPMREPFTRMVHLTNEGARSLGYSDLGQLWQSAYDMPAEDFRADTERLWSQVEPLYKELHCHVRAKLSDHYGEDKVQLDQPIPAHILGNMWGQTWQPIYDLVAPFPELPDTNASKMLVENNYSAQEMVRSAEEFYVSLGFEPLPTSFWERSQFIKPRDREVECHASAWGLEGGKDLRLKMCIYPAYSDLQDIYHELGHLFYFQAYSHQPPVFQDGAHKGFHEAVGDTVTLAMTPEYLHSQGLIEQAVMSKEAVLNDQMLRALTNLAVLPWTKLVDEWRWQVFSGEISADEYNSAWWQLREKYQGLSAPVERSEEDFDPGAKLHVAVNQSYSRYFLAQILQFQFFQAMCTAAQYTGPLHECSFFGSAEAGAKLKTMLSAGQSQPWQDSLEELTGTRQMDAGAIAEYFQPLLVWLKIENAERSCGW